MHIGFSYVLQCAYTCIGRKLSRLKKVQVSYQLTYMPCVGTCRHGSSDVITSHIHNFSLSMNKRSTSHSQEFHRCFRQAIIFKSQHYNTCMFTNIMHGKGKRHSPHVTTQGWSSQVFHCHNAWCFTCVLAISTSHLLLAVKLEKSPKVANNEIAKSVPSLLL